ncbi:MAG TPA: pyruvate kinase, partial [Bacillota bacterium]|nr:pyruvate kinase [Bacillota bacterium]HQO43335.1 pyruvate kinase [Bacillota bacterium]
MRKTKIVCTIGPATESEEMISRLVTAGMNVARLNFSHGDHAEHKRRIDAVKQVREKLGIPVAIMLDTKGPEVRLGYFRVGKAELEKGQSFTLTVRDIQGDGTKCSITYKELPDEVAVGSRILIADGVIELRVLDKNETDVICRVVNGGTLGDRKNVNIPGATSKLPAITDKDVADLVFGIENEVDFIAASFIRKAADVLEIRKILEENAGGHIQIIAKIENQEGVDNVKDILRVCDGLMVARGDLGVEIPTEEIPLTQKLLIKRANEAGKPVITATQMLDSMMRNPRPTRAEVTDVANSIIDGTDAIMLSGETAAGKYPVETVLTMSSIAERIERELDYGKSLSSFSGRRITIANAISHSSCTTAFELQAAAIITPTQSGSTARMVSKFRPKAPIIATTTNAGVMRKLCLSFGVYPIYVPFTERTDDIIDRAVDAAVESKLIKNGDLVVITAGIGAAGSTNLIKVHTVGEILAKGIGIGDRSVTGKVSIVDDIPGDFGKLREGDILVARSTDIEMIPLMEKASAFIVEEGGITSHAAIAGINLGKPVIVGVENAVSI